MGLLLMLSSTSAIKAQQYGRSSVDTIKTNTTDIYQYIGGESPGQYFPHAGLLSIAIRSDSLSGSTNGTAQVEAAYHHSPTIWVPVEDMTLTINGSAPQYAFFQFEGADLPARVRINYKGGATQSTIVRHEWFYRRQ